MMSLKGALRSKSALTLLLLRGVLLVAATKPVKTPVAATKPVTKSVTKPVTKAVAICCFIELRLCIRPHPHCEDRLLLTR